VRIGSMTRAGRTAACLRALPLLLSPNFLPPLALSDPRRKTGSLRGRKEPAPAEPSSGVQTLLAPQS
jgi:hypothetical protein